MKTFVLAVALSVTALSSAYAGSSNTVIYGNDDRMDLSDVVDPMQLRLADSTVALFKTRNVRVVPGSPYAELSTQPFGMMFHVCTSERFYDQRSGAFCSGTLVGPDLILTAGHCITDETDCAQTTFVFGFSIRDKNGMTPDTVSPDQVYQCKEIVQRSYADEGADFTLARIDRAVPDHEPARIDRNPALVPGDLLILIGHPSGLPTKVAPNAQVRDTSPNGYFVASTDSYAGNSGSGVFNQKTGLLEGVLVRGEQDFVRSPVQACFISNVCPETGCRGEDVTAASVFANLVPEAN